MECLSAFYSHFDWQTAKKQTFKNSKCAYWSETSRTRDRNLELLGPFSKCPHQHGWPKPTLRFSNSVWVSLLGVGDSVSGVPSCSLPGVYQQEAGAGSTAGLGSMHPWTRLPCLPRKCSKWESMCMCVYKILYYSVVSLLRNCQIASNRECTTLYFHPTVFVSIPFPASLQTLVTICLCGCSCLGVKCWFVTPSDCVPLWLTVLNIFMCLLLYL